MRIAVLGASRHTGQSFVSQALASNTNIQLTILARTPANLPFPEDQLSQITVIQGDALNKNDVATTINGADIVICSLGAKMDGFSKPIDMGVEESGIMNILDIVKETQGNPPRLIMVSSTGVGTHNDVPWLMRPLYSLLLSAPHGHKARAEIAIKKSGVPYTLVRPAWLTNGDMTKTYRAGEGVRGYTVSRNDVAHFILNECVLETKWVNASPSIAY
ncbi:hypothetical protein IWW56_005965 [Coemansia sp. RSA 2131]|nr:hypothetical protein IWW56_005965 [Coemansia sp. RSA 2131]